MISGFLAIGGVYYAIQGRKIFRAPMTNTHDSSSDVEKKGEVNAYVVPVKEDDDVSSV